MVSGQAAGPGTPAAEGPQRPVVAVDAYRLHPGPQDGEVALHGVHVAGIAIAEVVPNVVEG